jgi:hypothetical protein
MFGFNFGASRIDFERVEFILASLFSKIDFVSRIDST